MTSATPVHEVRSQRARQGHHRRIPDQWAFYMPCVSHDDVQALDEGPRRRYERVPEELEKPRHSREDRSIHKQIRASHIHGREPYHDKKLFLIGRMRSLRPSTVTVAAMLLNKDTSEASRRASTKLSYAPQCHRYRPISMPEPRSYIDPKRKGTALAGPFLHKRL
jgi:hypothetical protein